MYNLKIGRKGLLKAVELEKGCDQTAGLVEWDIKPIFKCRATLIKNQFTIKKTKARSIGIFILDRIINIYEWFKYPRWR